MLVIILLILQKINKTIYMKYIKSFEDFIAENKISEEGKIVEGTETSEVNEAASISSISSKLEKVIKDMKKTVGQWKEEKDADKKAKLKDTLKGLTDKKKALEKELHEAIEDLDKDAELEAED